MTLEGTNTYIVGSDPAYLIDPGPAAPSHVEAVLALGAQRGGFAGILLTHSHADHTEAVAVLEAVGAPLLVGAVSERDEAHGTMAPVPAPATPEEVGPFTVVPTPGHATDHLCFVLGEVCFCGDLVLGHGSSIVPPAALGGSLREYLRSLESVRNLGSALLCPGHGPWINDPRAKLAEYAEHRAERERRLVEALAAGERSRRRLLEAAWGDVPAPLRPVAALAMEAHLEKLEGEGGLPPGLDG